MTSKLSPRIEPTINELRLQIASAGCDVFVAGSTGYRRTTDIWNGAVENQPALVARCTNVRHIQASLAAATQSGVPISVKGGGHDWCGRGVRDGGLVLDLSGMRAISVNRDSKIAVMEGGALCIDATVAAESAELAVVTAYSGAVGMAGLVMGGGYGPLATRFGLAADSLAGAEVVLADGRLVMADSEENSDLYWALRGGGGNFGVVTSMRIRLHQPAAIVSGLVVFPWSDARTVLRGYAELMESASDEFSAAIVMSTGADGVPTIAVAPTWTGDPVRAEAAVEQLQRLGTPVVTKVAQTTCSKMLAGYDNLQVVNGRHNVVQTRWLRHLTADAIEALIEGCNSRTSRFSSVVLHHFHGAGTRVDPSATPFGMRAPHFTALIYSAWEAGGDVDATTHGRWAHDLSARLAPHSLPGGYANLLSPDAREQISGAYGENGPRLREVKVRYDPGNIFSSAIPLP